MENNSFQEKFRTSRSQRSTNIAASYVENRVVIPGAEGLTWVAETGQFEEPSEAKRQERMRIDIWSEANEEVAELFSVLDTARNKVNKKSHDDKIVSSLRKSGWSDVVDEVNSLAMHYRQGSLKFKSCLEAVGENSEVLEAWLGLLPAGDYGSGICGVFKLVVGAAKRFVKVEDCVFEALESIPTMMMSAKRYIEIYRDHGGVALEMKTFKLFRSILVAMKHIVQYFADGKLKKVTELFFKQTSYRSKLTESLEDVKKNMQKMLDEAVECSHSLLADTKKDTHQIRLNTEEILRKFSDTKLEEKRGRDLTRQIYVLLKNQEADSSRKQTSQSAFLIENNISSKNSSRESLVVNSQQPLQVAKIQGHGISPNRFLEVLGYDQKSFENDTATCLSFGASIDDREASRASAVVLEDRFKQWLTGETDSCSLLVNGHAESEDTTMTPFSFLSAQLAQLFKSATSAFVLGYFCGCHIYDNASSATPVGMMSSLVGQLVSQMMEKGIKPDLSFLTDNDIQDVANGELDILCFVLRDLVGQLPEGATVFCSLDEPNLFETAESNANTEKIIRRLVRLVKNAQVIVKLLVTCYGESLYFKEHFQGNILDLEESVENDDEALWNLGHLE